MNDQHDNEQADREMLARFGQAAEQVRCRWCWREIFIEDRGRNPGKWILMYLEYPNSENCDARSDGAVLSSLPHEPLAWQGVTLSSLVRIAAQSITMPGSAAIRDTNTMYDYGLVRMVCEAAGLTERDEDYVYHAIIEEGCKSRGDKREFQRAAFQAGLLSPPASWGDRIGIGIAHPIRKRDRGSSRVRNLADAEARERKWIEDGRLGHPFDAPGEAKCRVCGCKPDGIQHQPGYPRQGDLTS